MGTEELNIEKRISMTKINYFFYMINLEYDECGQSEPMIALRPYTRTTSIAIPCSTSNLICCHQLRFAAYEVDLHCWGLDLIVRGLNFSIDMLDLVEKRVSFLTSAAHPVKLK